MKITETDSNYQDLEMMSTLELLNNINKEDLTVAQSVQKVIPWIEACVDKIYEQMAKGGRLFYIGAGTSGRLGIVDASECPPTFGVPHELVIGLIAGGDSAIRKAVEFAEDSSTQASMDLEKYALRKTDFVIGIAASGTTPYVIGGLRYAQNINIPTACITCNPGAPIVSVSDYPIECAVGPEFITGSTRMKAGTAQKLILNMISTSVMVKMGKVKGNKMVDMQLSNDKLVERGTKMVMDQTGINFEEAQRILLEEESVRKAITRIIGQKA